MGFCSSSPLFAWREKTEYWYKSSNFMTLLANTGSGQGRMERNKRWSGNQQSTEGVFTTALYSSGLSLEHLSHLYLVCKSENRKTSHIASEMPSLKHCPQKWYYQSHSCHGWVTWIYRKWPYSVLLPPYVAPGEGVLVVPRAQTQLWAVIWWKLHTGKACLATSTRSKQPPGLGASSFPLSNISSSISASAEP